MRFLFFLWIAVTGSLFGQQAENVSLLYQYDDPDLPETGSGIAYNDCWGYMGSNGEEIAILGTLDSVLFFDITDPNQVVKLPGVGFSGSSLWRDFKTYENYCYAVADQRNDGLTIINMDSIMAGVATYRSDNSAFASTHNIWIDTAMAKLYAVGSNTENNDLIIYDLSVDPFNPTVWAQYDLKNHGINCSNTYVHDLHVRNDTAYCNVIYNNCGFYVLDVSDPAGPSIIGSLPGSAFGGGLNHSNWVSEDGSFGAVAEETHGMPLYFVDFEDLSDMEVVSTFQEPLFEPDSNNNIVHNPFIRGNLCYIAYYHDGLQVLDVSDPSDPVRVGYYDTDSSPTTYSGFKGAWGTYPYFPSGHVIVSDVQNGLHVLEIDQSLMAAEWQDLQAWFLNGKQFGLRTDFQTTYALEQVIVQWSPDGRDFEDWADIDPDVFAHLMYHWSGRLDRPQADAFFIRIQTIESDGTFSFSPIRRVDAAGLRGNTVFPQPAAQNLQIASTTKGHWLLRNLKGQVVFETPVEAKIQSIQLPSTLASGLYIGIWRSEFGDLLDQQKVVINQDGLR
jgi:choice-of-anchor B domain-containing protein